MVASIRDHMILVERLFLTEHNVINPQDVDSFVKRFITRTRPEAGKAWFQKKLRSFIINDDQYLIKLTPDDLAVMKNLPDYVTAAVERGETLYDFQSLDSRVATSISDLIQHMYHVSDWFNALDTVVKRKPANQIEIEDQKLAAKWLEKLSKIPVTEIEEIADEWFAHMGTRIKAEKSGVEVVMTWPNGFYAVRFTDKNTMMSDGRDLQNCLQQGYYWEDVKTGRGAVYAIRKPNDEAVVGIRVKGRHLEECKGKNNKPVSAQYVPYVVSFLTSMNWDIEDNYDLEAAGIEVHDSKIGSFEDVAPVVYDKNGLKIWQTSKKFLAKTNSSIVEGNIHNKAISEILFSKNENPDEDEDQDKVKFENLDDLGSSSEILKILNIIKLPPTGMLAVKLEGSGIFFYDGRYGDARDVGKQVFKVDDYQGYEVAVTRGSQTVQLILMYSHDEKVGRFSAMNNKLVDFNLQRWGAYFADDLIKILNAMGFPPTNHNKSLENQLAKKFGIYFDKTKYGKLADTSKPDIKVGEVSIVRLGKRPMWIASYKDEEYSSQQRFWLAKGVLEYSDPVRIGGHAETEKAERIDKEYAEAVRKLALKYKVKHVEDGSQFDILNLGKSQDGIVADFDSLLEAAEKTKDVAYALFNDDISSKLLNYLIKIGQKFSTEDQRKIYDAFKVKDGPNLKWGILHSSKVYDIEVPDIKIALPNANPYLVEKGIITDKALKAEIERDSLASIKAARDLVASKEYGTFQLQAYFSKKVTTAVNLLSREIEEKNTKTNNAIRERRANPDKYATDLSSRFAALNAFNKKKTY